MKFFASIPRRVRFALAVIALNLALLLLLRLTFLGIFYGQSSPLASDKLLKAFYVGMKFDLRLALLIPLPIVFLSWLPGLNIVRSRVGRRIWHAYLVIVGAVLAFFYLTDFGHFAYLKSRVNSSVLEYLSAPDISARMVWETYPVVWGVLGFIAFLLVYGWVLTLIAALTLDGAARATGWARRLAVVVLFAGFVLLGLYGKLAYYPLRWSEAFFTPHPLAVALGLNPVLYFYDTMEQSGRDFDEERVRGYYDDVAAYLGLQNPDKASLRFARRVVPKAKVAGQPNVVVIFLESYAAFKVGAFGNPLDPTPNFDALARQGLFFNRFFVPSTGTARSIFTAMFGIPDVNLNSTSSRNPFVVNQHTIVNTLEGYEKLYFLGGSANWGNIRGVLSHNIRGLRIYEEGDYASPRTDVWGISDLHLFEEANQVLRTRQDKPFFAVIQTAGNHRPYTIPEQNRGFVPADPPVEDWTSKGFLSKDEFNSFRFMDHSLGHFFRLARKEGYFNNTIFVMFGDHGLPGSADHFPAGMGKHQLVQHLVPLVIYAPGLIEEPREISAVASELDVMPTIAGLLGAPYLNTTLGRDLLERNGEKRYAFILIPYQTPPPVGLLDEEFYFLIDADQRKKLYRYLSDTPEEDVRGLFPNRAAEMERLTLGLYETARYLLYHNAATRAQ
jgi:phosphoglycerol transferase MdoB-like AlkP superfamily enzyme